MFTTLVATLFGLASAQFFDTKNEQRPFGPGYNRGAYPQDFGVMGSALEAVHDSQEAPTGFAVTRSGSEYNIYLTYPRNSGPTKSNVVIATGFNTEKPWPSAEIQNCTAGQDLSTCFINVQNVVLDSIGQLWIVDSGIPASASSSPSPQATYPGAKIMSFNETTGHLIKTFPIPAPLLAHGTNANDVRINNTLNAAFLTDESTNSSLLAVNLTTNTWTRRLFNTSVVRADPNFVSSYDGHQVYLWNGTRKSYATTGADGIALASGNFYWGVLASRRFYYVSQTAVLDTNITDAQLLDMVQDPGQCASEQAGFTADSLGRVYIFASEQNAIFYVDTLQSQVNETVNGTPAGGEGNVKSEDYVVKTLVRNAMIQHADSGAVLDGWVWFCTNQLELSPGRVYGNKDLRRGPFRSFRVWVGEGRGPAV